jgi:hypothetical protein
LRLGPFTFIKSKPEAPENHGFPGLWRFKARKNRFSGPPIGNVYFRLTVVRFFSEKAQSEYGV